MGYGGNLEPTPFATLHIVATLQIFADLCRSLLLCRSDFPEAALQVPAFSKHLTERMPIKLYDVKNHYYDGHPKTIFLFKKAKIALVDIWPPLTE